MTSRRLRMFTLFALAGVAGSPAFAHHSQAMFDMSRCMKLEGTVRAFEYSFPHSWLWIDAVQDDMPVIWAFEAAAPIQMMEIDKRWSRNVVKKGDKVAIQFSPHKNGGHSGSLHSLVLPEGTRLLAATPACGQEADAIGGPRPAPNPSANPSVN